MVARGECLDARRSLSISLSSSSNHQGTLRRPSRVRSRRRDLCVRLGWSRPFGPLEDVTVAAEVLIDDALTQRPPASFAVGVNGSEGHFGHRRCLSLIELDPGGPPGPEPDKVCGVWVAHVREGWHWAGAMVCAGQDGCPPARPSERRASGSRDAGVLRGSECSITRAGTPVTIANGDRHRAFPRGRSESSRYGCGGSCHAQVQRSPHTPALTETKKR